MIELRGTVARFEARTTVTGDPVAIVTLDCSLPIEVRAVLTDHREGARLTKMVKHGMSCAAVVVRLDYRSDHGAAAIVTRGIRSLSFDLGGSLFCAQITSF